MYDPRVVRGNTYAAIVTSKEQTLQQQKRRIPVRKRIDKKEVEELEEMPIALRESTPPP
jgi:hypothetical protein